MRILQIAILSLVLTSCWTNSKIQREAHKRGLCGRDSTSKLDSVIVTKHDTVIVHPEKEGDEISFDFGENCDSIKSLLATIRKNPIVQKKNGLTETVKSNGKSLTFGCKEDAYSDSLKNARINTEFWRYQYENNTKIVYKDSPETWKQVLYRHGFWWMLLILVALGLWKSRNLWLHLIFPKV